MSPGDPNVLRVELVAAALGDLCDELVLVGGCAASLLFENTLPGLVAYDELHQSRIEAVRHRISAIAGLETQ